MIFNTQTRERIDGKQQQPQQHSQTIINNRLVNDSFAEILIENINRIYEITAPISQSTNNGNDNDDECNERTRSTMEATTLSSPYPPINRVGVVSDHDRPYADYGHLDRRTIAQEFQFDLNPPVLPPSTTTTTTTTITTTTTTDTVPRQQHQRRLHARSFAITGWTNVSKEIVMNTIKEDFGIENIQYICVGEEISELNHRRHLHIQIILKQSVNRRKPFLDDITQTHCNYQVTQNDRAWNEYIKKGGDYIELNTFRSTTVRSHKQWSQLLLSTSSSSLSSTTSTPIGTTTDSNTSIVDATIPVVDDATVTTTTINTTTVVPQAALVLTARAKADEKRQFKDILAKQAIELAKTNVNAALKHIENQFPWDYLRNSQWYKATLKDVYLQELYKRTTIDTISINYTWPKSFPDCTSNLRQVVDRWIQEEFNRASRAKCLILIGPTGTGKTCFAKSLPGPHNYFKGRWRLDTWNDHARYSIFDDIDWDKYESLGFPSKKDLLTQNGTTIATDKYKTSREIQVRQPAIVLLNPGLSEGSLTAQPTSINEQEEVNYWQHRAVIYRMGPNEYFHRPDYHNQNNHK